VELKTEEIVISEFKGCKRHNFTVNGREALVVEPNNPTEGRPWVWRTEFFDAFSQVDDALLEKGWHLAYIKVSGMFGCNDAIEIMNNFYNVIVEHFKLNSRAAIFGFSRGGLYAFNYAVKYPNHSAGLYLDAPVLNILSWPAGRGQGIGSPPDWELCLAAYGLTEETALDFKDNPLDKIEKAVKFGIPVLLIAGDSDEVVPYSENGAFLAEKCEEYGKIKVIIKEGCGHHPHSVEDVTGPVKYILETFK
jgi:pimeloyl-ACP methyl ester carboxylesterase